MNESFLRSVVFPVFTGISLKDLAVFYRQMGAMLNAGISVHRTLTTMEEQLPGGVLRKAVHDVAGSVYAGGALSGAMARYPHIFSELQIEFIASSEQTGGIGPMMNRLADYLEQDYELRQMVKKETFYPKMVFVLTFLLPNLVIMFVSGLQAYVDQSVKPLLLLLAGGLGIYVAFRYAMQSSTFRYVVDTIKSYIPYFGKTVRMLAIGKFSRALAALYSAGILLPVGIEISARVSGNQYLTTLIMRVVAAIKAGRGLADAFRDAGVFPPMFISMLATGEETGRVDDMLHKVADFFEEESKLRLHQSVQVLTQGLFLIIGIIVGVIVIQTYTEYFSNILSVAQ